jgi:hypothetical protein
MSTHRRMSVLHGLSRPRWKAPAWVSWLLAALALLSLLYLVSPYVTLWRLERAVAAAPPSAQAGFVDIAAVRDQIRRRLNKDAESRIGEVSDSFIDWLQLALRRSGDDALEQTVTLDWLRGLLAAHRTTGRGLPVEHAFYATPFRFRVRVGGDPPLQLVLEPRWLGWRVTAVYY